MKLENAIEILELLERTLAPTMVASGTDALKLGIEALKEVNALRKVLTGLGNSLLPGETPEQEVEHDQG